MFLRDGFSLVRLYCHRSRLIFIDVAVPLPTSGGKIYCNYLKFDSSYIFFQLILRHGQNSVALMLMLTLAKTEMLFFRQASERG